MVSVFLVKLHEIEVVTPRKRPVVPVMSISMRLLNFDFCWCTSSCCKNHCPLPTPLQTPSKLCLYCRWSILYVLIVFKSQWKFHLFCPSVDFTWVYWFPSARPQVPISWRIWDSNLLNKYLEAHNFLGGVAEGSAGKVCVPSMQFDRISPQVFPFSPTMIPQVCATPNNST